MISDWGSPHNPQDYLARNLVFNSVHVISLKINPIQSVTSSIAQPCYCGKPLTGWRLFRNFFIYPFRSIVKWV